MLRFKMSSFTIPLRYARRNAGAAGGCAFCPGVCGAHHPALSFRDGPKDQTRNLEIPGSMLRIAPE